MKLQKERRNRGERKERISAVHPRSPRALDKDVESSTDPNSLKRQGCSEPSFCILSVNE